MTSGVRWFSGRHKGLVWASGLALVDGSMPSSDVERIWTTMHRDPSLGTFLEVLGEVCGHGLLHLPPFAVALIGPQGCHLAVRGDLVIQADTDTGPVHCSGEGVTTWVERQIPAALSIAVGEATGESLPIGDGIVPAGGLAWGDRAVPDRILADAGAVSHPAWSAPVIDVPRAEPAAPAHDDGGVAEPLAESWSTPARLRETRFEDDAQPSVRSRYDSLLADSIAVSPEDAAVRPEQDLGLGQVSVDGRRPGAPDDEDDVAAVAVAPHPTGSSGQAGRFEAPSTDLHDGHTVFFDGPPAQAPVPDTSVSVMPNSSQPTVLACFCGRGHANPPQRSLCRVCGDAVDARQERTSRPSLGRIRLTSGERFDLVGPLIAGRSPTSGTRFAGQLARLVPLPHPHISGNHLEITLEGWTVLVRDLNSTNGTYLRRPGKPVMRLAEQAVPLAEGDVLDLGHGVFLYLEQLP